MSPLSWEDWSQNIGVCRLWGLGYLAQIFEVCIEIFSVTNSIELAGISKAIEIPCIFIPVKADIKILDIWEPNLTTHFSVYSGIHAWPLDYYVVIKVHYIFIES